MNKSIPLLIRSVYLLTPKNIQKWVVSKSTPEKVDFPPALTILYLANFGSFSFSPPEVCLWAKHPEYHCHCFDIEDFPTVSWVLSQWPGDHQGYGGVKGGSDIPLRLPGQQRRDWVCVGHHFIIWSHCWARHDPRPHPQWCKNLLVSFTLPDLSLILITSCLLLEGERFHFPFGAKRRTFGPRIFQLIFDSSVNPWRWEGLPFFPKQLIFSWPPSILILVAWNNYNSRFRRRDHLLEEKPGSNLGMWFNLCATIFCAASKTWLCHSVLLSVRIAPFGNCSEEQVRAVWKKKKRKRKKEGKVDTGGRADLIIIVTPRSVATADPSMKVCNIHWRPPWSNKHKGSLFFPPFTGKAYVRPSKSTHQPPSLRGWGFLSFLSLFIVSPFIDRCLLLLFQNPVSNDFKQCTSGDLNQVVKELCPGKTRAGLDPHFLLSSPSVRKLVNENLSILGGLFDAGLFSAATVTDIRPFLADKLLKAERLASACLDLELPFNLSVESKVLLLETCEQIVAAKILWQVHSSTEGHLRSALWQRVCENAGWGYEENFLRNRLVHQVCARSPQSRVTYF